MSNDVIRIAGLGGLKRVESGISKGSAALPIIRKTFLKNIEERNIQETKLSNLDTLLMSYTSKVTEKLSEIKKESILSEAAIATLPQPIFQVNALYMASYFNDVDTIIKLSEKKIDPNQIQPDTDQSALHIATSMFVFSISFIFYFYIINNSIIYFRS